jgi:hypothetical protein
LLSPSGSGLCLSREELSDAIVAYLAEHRPGLRCNLNSGYIGKLERGIYRWPFAHYREALRAILGRSTDAELGFFKIHSRKVDGDSYVPGDAGPTLPGALAVPDAVPAVAPARSVPGVAVPVAGTVAGVQVTVSAEPGTAVTVLCPDGPAGRVAVVAGGVRVLIEPSGTGPVSVASMVPDLPAVSGGARVYSLAERRAR